MSFDAPHVNRETHEAVHDTVADILRSTDAEKKKIILELKNQPAVVETKDKSEYGVRVRDEKGNIITKLKEGAVINIVDAKYNKTQDKSGFDKNTDHLWFHIVADADATESGEPIDGWVSSEYIKVALPKTTAEGGAGVEKKKNPKEKEKETDSAEDELDAAMNALIDGDARFTGVEYDDDKNVFKYQGRILKREDVIKEGTPEKQKAFLLEWKLDIDGEIIAEDKKLGVTYDKDKNEFHYRSEKLNRGDGKTLAEIQEWIKEAELRRVVGGVGGTSLRKPYKEWKGSPAVGTVEKIAAALELEWWKRHRVASETAKALDPAPTVEQVKEVFQRTEANHDYPPATLLPPRPDMHGKDPNIFLEGTDDVIADGNEYFSELKKFKEAVMSGRKIVEKAGDVADVTRWKYDTKPLQNILNRLKIESGKAEIIKDDMRWSWNTDDITHSLWQDGLSPEIAKVQKLIDNVAREGERDQDNKSPKASCEQVRAMFQKNKDKPDTELLSDQNRGNTPDYIVNGLPVTDIWKRMKFTIPQSFQNRFFELVQLDESGAEISFTDREALPYIDYSSDDMPTQKMRLTSVQKASLQILLGQKGISFQKLQEGVDAISTLSKQKNNVLISMLKQYITK